MMPRTIDPFEKIIERCEWTESGCLVWTGGCNRDGYGYICAGYKDYRVHIVVFERIRYKVPDGLVLDHLYEIRKCIFPYHLEVVTNKINILRGNGITAIHARKTHCIHGHEFNEENTLYVKRGRACKKCRKRWAEYGPDYMYV